MPVGSPAFLCFVAVALLVYWLLPAAFRNRWLVVTSLGYAASWGLAPAALLGGLTVFNVLLGELFDTTPQRRRVLLAAGLTVNVVSMLLLRHAQWMGPGGTIGLSFYGLQAISYLLDRSRQVLNPRPARSDVALYLLYFAKITAGPVERAAPFLRDLKRSRVVDDDTVFRSVGLLASGMVRKLWIAETFAGTIPPGAFTDPARFDAATLTYALIAGVFYLYNDFAGYTDTVRGLSGLFGIELSPNFAQPFFARSFSEFWTSWHASFMAWLREYVYIPISRMILRRDPRLRGAANIVLPPLATMLVSGLWHGTSPRFVVWGVLEGSYLAGERWISLWRQRRVGKPRAAGSIFTIPLVFVLGLIAFVPFYMDLDTAAIFLQRVATANAWAAPSATLSLALAASLLLDGWERLAPAASARVWTLRPVRVALLVFVVLGWLLSGVDVYRRPFMYQLF